MKKIMGFLLGTGLFLVLLMPLVRAEGETDPADTVATKQEACNIPADAKDKKVIDGVTLAVIGAIITIVFSGFGSAKGITLAAAPATGVMSESPDMFGKLLILVTLPGTQGIYGFVTGFLVLLKIGIIGGTIQAVTFNQGMQVLGICIFQSFILLTSAIYQGKVAAYGIVMTGKKPEASMKGVILAVLVETYAVLGLLAGILGIWFGIRF